MTSFKMTNKRISRSIAPSVNSTAIGQNRSPLSFKSKLSNVPETTDKAVQLFNDIK